MSAMIVRLFTTSKGFPAIRYNMEKVSRGEAELLCRKNLEIFDGFERLKTADLEHYFGAVASLNSRSRFDQFHAVLSVRGDSMGQARFAEISHSWMEKMGYASQPYLVFFHSDTHNAHVHILSTDVRLDGSKIPDGFDRVRAIGHLNRICGIDEQESFKKDLSRLLSYRCSSTSQLKALLGNSGYHFFSYQGNFLIRRYGKTLMRINAAGLQARLSQSFRDVQGSAGVRKIILAAMDTHSAMPEPIYQQASGKQWRRISGYRSELADFLMRSEGLEICYHFSRAGVTGLSLIDHRDCRLFDAEEIMPLSLFLASGQPSYQHSRPRFLGR
ncbi:relaxase/mobilization nuclease domain-containing protein [Pedobacter roseus]|uniref:Relaxase/mobilization nuclease domain-containing protein n=1 Tax=Pedobacter roseus TaxID=336820 RepID=A0A7G9QI08_9SPHI|nr:relaxase/mobilization nuclease domain-containing protein [Pedobacter roseus]QNN42983.1 relaxase/mobilization nuclease domain-containing protein [Pedobacter roseus]